MLESLLTEIKERSGEITDSIRSIYFGGGTPSLLAPKEIEQLLQAVRDNFSCDSDPEVTLECNPDDGDLNYFDKIRAVGVNRLSVGIQSFSDKDLNFLGRAHNSEQGQQCLSDVKKAGFENVTVDIIYGIPGSSDAQLKENVDYCLEEKVKHISAYALTAEHGTLLMHWIKNGKQSELDEGFQNDQFYQIRDYLIKHDFVHYELSNYGQDGYRSVHNQNYWSRNNYLGIGPSAHSYSHGIRRWNVSNNAHYMRNIENKESYFEEETLSPNSVYNEKVLVGLRRSSGIQLSGLGEFESFLLEEIRPFVKKGWLEKELDHVRATAKGLIWLDHMSEHLFKIEE